MKNQKRNLQKSQNLNQSQKKKQRTAHRHFKSLKYSCKGYDSDPADGRYYKGAYLLNEGEYSDSITMSPVVYSNDELEKATQLWSRKCLELDDERIFINADHRPDESLKRVGYLPKVYFKDNAIRGDLYFHRITQNSKEIVKMIDAEYLNGLSVEIITEDYWDSDTNKRCASNIELVGLAVVTMPADSKAKVK